MNHNFTQRLSFLALVAVLLIAFAFGGGGSRYGLANLTVQLAAIAALVPHRVALAQFWRTAGTPLRLLILLSLLLPLLQIVPLPPAIWTALPGRDLVARSLEMVGDQTVWMPFSTNPQRTILALSALITPLAVLIIGWSLPRPQLLTIGWLVAALGLVTMLLGLLQLGATDDSGTLFGSRNPGSVLLGTFANRNSTGLLLGFSLGLAALLPVPRSHPVIPFARVAICGLLVLTIFLTKSRTAILLAALPLGLAGLKALWWALGERRALAGTPNAGRAGAIVLGAIALLAVSGTALILAAPGRIGEALERFEAKDDPRRFIWEDAAYSAARYWPAGAGIGTFDEVFQVDESLENLTVRTAGRAHNDYLELTIEAGLPGLALAGLWMLLIAWMSWRARHSSQAWAAWAGSCFLLAIALQSITDYPLRNQTILAFAAFALVLLGRIAADQQKERP